MPGPAEALPALVDQPIDGALGVLLRDLRPTPRPPALMAPPVRSASSGHLRQGQKDLRYLLGGRHTVGGSRSAHAVSVADVEREPAPRVRRSPIRAASRWLVAAALLGFAWLAGGLSSFTRPAEVTTFATVAAVLGYAAVRRRDRAPVRLARTGVAVWTAWLAAVTGWELWALFSVPRSSHPTISSLVDELISSHPARAAAVLLWLLVGWWLARR